MNLLNILVPIPGPVNISLQEERDFAAVIKDTEMVKLFWITQVDLRYNQKYP